MNAVPAREGAIPMNDGFQAPPIGPDIEPLPRVHAHLDRATDGVATVCAPAGYGKTTQVAIWAARSTRPVIWADLGEEDNDPQTFSSRLGSMLESVTPVGVDAGAQSLGSHLQMVVPAVTEMLRRVDRPLVVVLDDIHVIDDPTTLDILDTVVDNVPSGSTVVLIGRRDPGVSLGRLWAEDRVRGITPSDLALGAADARAVFESMGVDVDDARVDQYVHDTEGWPIGLRLAALASREEGGATGSLGHDPIATDFVHDQWLRGLDVDDIDLLLRASAFEWMSGRLCDDVLGRSDSGARLERLHRDGLLVVPLDRRGDTYRLHALLREVLDADFERLDRAERRSIDRAACAWFEREGDIDRAVHHATRLRDDDLIAELITRHAPELHTRGRNASVRRWLDQMSITRLHSDPDLCLVAAITAVGLGEEDDARTWVRIGMEACRPATGDGTESSPYLKFLTLSSLMSLGPARASLIDATRAYDRLPSGIWHAAACQAVGVQSHALGLDEVAASRFAEGAAEARITQAPTIQAECRAQLAVMCGERGDWEEATTVAREARQLLRDHQLENMPHLAVVTAISAHVEALAGDPASARSDMLLTRRNLSYITGIGAWVNVQARLSLAHTCLLLGDRAGARTLVDEAAGYLRMQPDATSSHVRLEELEASLRAARNALPVGPSSLTTAELGVLHFLPTNLSLAEIAQHLHVTRNTAKSHAAAIYRKLGVSARGDAVTVAREASLLPR
jgi:LuxR family transcriptional regulator, maltose regulon positive regulatory protein